MAPPIESMPLPGLQLLRNMLQAGWNPQVAYGRAGAAEYWQVAGTWGDVRTEGWWRRPVDVDWSQWKSLMIVTVRGADHDPADFRALDPRQADADTQVQMKMSQVGVSTNMLSPERFTAWVTARANTP